MSTEEVFDAGLQPERTLLAWHRTCLALAVGSMLAVRFLAIDFGMATASIGVSGLLATSVAWFGATARYRRGHLALTGPIQLLEQGALPMVAMALAAALLALGAGVYLIGYGAWQ